MREYLLVMLVAAAVTFLASGVCRRVALRAGALAHVRDRDVHTVAMPYFGGVAMFLGLLSAIVLAWQLPFLGRQPLVGQDSLAVLVAAAVICAVGVLDDLYDLRAYTKFAGQVLAAGIVVALGVRMLWIPLPGQVISLDYGASVAITVFFIVLCSNAVNFVDGLDGLATGVVGIGAGAFFAYSYVLYWYEGLSRATTSGLIAVAIVGICLGFLPHNFFPARMFMGDSGAMLLGLLLATSTVSLTGQLDPSQLSDGGGVAGGIGGGLVPLVLPLVLPLAILALPFLDLSMAFIRRTYAGRWWFLPDKQHLHHRLLERGHSQRRAVLLMYAWSALVSFGVIVLGLVRTDRHWQVVAVVLLIAVVLVLATLGRPIRGLRRPQRPPTP
ncbi:MAG: MraY family glycosyltransferase [Microlunatus sp.]